MEKMWKRQIMAYKKCFPGNDFSARLVRSAEALSTGKQSLETGFIGAVLPVRCGCPLRTSRRGALRPVCASAEGLRLKCGCGFLLRSVRFSFLLLFPVAQKNKNRPSLLLPLPAFPSPAVFSAFFAPPGAAFVGFVGLPVLLAGR